MKLDRESQNQIRKCEGRNNQNKERSGWGAATIDKVLGIEMEKGSSAKLFERHAGSDGNCATFQAPESTKDDVKVLADDFIYAVRYLDWLIHELCSAAIWLLLLHDSK